MDSERADVDPRNTGLPRLSTAQAAARLGVKPATLYAYVARGRIASRRGDRGGSTFDPIEVEAFAASHRREAVGRADDGSPLMVLDSPITAVTADSLRFRGEPAVRLAAALAFESAVELLWAAGPVPAGAFRGDPGAAASARAAAGVLGAGPLDRLRVAALAAAAADPLRADLAPDAVRRAGARLLGTMVDALPPAGPDPGAAAPIRERLWARIAPRAPQPGDAALLDAALVLSMDHDLAASTFAARVAASARADPYACVQAALGAFGGALHGSVSAAAAALVADAMASGSPEAALSRAVAATGSVPGFGHVVYRRHDPRADFLLGRMRALPRYERPLGAALRLEAVVAERLQRPANLDLALAVLTLGAGAEPQAGAVVFAVARTAGWIAHAVEEYAAPPLRLRPRSRYSGADADRSRADRRRSIRASSGPVSTSSQ